MNKLKTMLFCGCLLAAPALAAPAIDKGGVTNAASNIAPGLPNYGIARGSLFVVKGTGFGSGATVSVGGTEAPVVAATETQVVATLPSGAATGDAKVTVAYNGETSNEEPIKIVDRAFGIFIAGGMAVTLPAATAAQSAQPGQALSLYGTGLGEGDVEVWVGGKAATVNGQGPSSGAGLDGIGFPYAPGTAGIDQIDFTVPEGVQGCRVAIVVRTGDVVSNFATLPVMPEAGPCTDDNGLNADDYGKLLAGGQFKFGSISLSRSSTKMDIPGFGTMDMSSDNGSGSFFSYEAADLLANTGTISQTSIGSCTVMTFRFEGEQLNIPQVKFTALDAGSALTVTGPKGTKQMNKQKDGSYSAEFYKSGFSIPGMPSIPGLPGASDPPFLEAGDYTVTGPGGADVGAFTANLTISTPIKWTNQDEIQSVERGAGVQVTWTGGGEKDIVSITGTSIDMTNKVAGMFYCTEKAPVGQFTVQPPVLLSLPVSGEDVPGTLGLQNGATARFTASGIDLGALNSSVSVNKTVPYK